MNIRTEIINIKTDQWTKEKAGKIAGELGFSLSTLLNAFLRQFIRNKAIYFSTTAEEPSEYLLRSFSTSEKDVKAGRVSPSFRKPEEAMRWLKNPKRKYQG